MMQIEYQPAYLPSISSAIFTRLSRIVALRSRKFPLRILHCKYISPCVSVLLSQRFNANSALPIGMHSGVWNESMA